MLKIKALCVCAIMLLSPLGNAQDQLSWVGDWDSYHAYMKNVAQAYRLKNGQVIELSTRGTSKGIRAVFAGQTDMGGAGRYRLEGLPEEDRVEMLPVAWDPLVVAVHPDNALVNISQDQLKNVLTGSITNWSDLGGSSAPLALYHRADDLSGVGYTIRKVLFADASVEFPGGTAVEPDVDLGELINNDPNGIGLMGFAAANAAGLRLLSIDGKVPSTDSIVRGDYLFYRILYMVTNPSHDRRADLLQFRQFVQSPVGQAAISESGSIPFLKAPQLKLKELEQDRVAHGLGF